MTTVFEDFVLDNLQPYQIVLISAVVFFSMERVSGIISQASLETYRNMKQAKKDSHNVAVTGMIHSILLFQGAFRAMLMLDNFFKLPLYLVNSPELPVDTNDHQAERLCRFYMSMATGYFCWDVILCVTNFSAYGLMFTVHAVFGVVSIGAGVFMPATTAIISLMFFGNAIFLFELSNPFLNMRTFMYVFGMSKSIWYNINNAIFALTFFLGRILFGIPLCLAMIRFAFESHFHTDPQIDIFLRGLWMLSPFVSMLLNITWFFEVIKAVRRGGESKVGLASNIHPDESSKKK